MSGSHMPDQIRFPEYRNQFLSPARYRGRTSVFERIPFDVVDDYRIARDFFGFELQAVMNQRYPGRIARLCCFAGAWR